MRHMLGAQDTMLQHEFMHDGVKHASTTRRAQSHAHKNTNAQT